MDNARDRIDLRPDSIVSALQKHDEPVLPLKGYVGESPVDNKVRLYWDLSLRRYYDISADDILDRIPLGPNLGSVLIVKLSANLEAVEESPVDARWLDGAISSEYLPTSGGTQAQRGCSVPPTTHLTR